MDMRHKPTFEGETLSARLRLVRPYALQVKHAHTAGIWYNGTQSLDTYRKWTKQGFDCYLLVRVMLKSWSLTIDGERFNARYYSPQLGGLSYVVVPSTLYEEVHKNSQANLFRYEVNVPTTFEIIVLTMNRAKSVMRLLKSLEASEYGSEQIQLTIHVDYRAGNQDTVDIVNNYSWPHGSKRVVVRRANIGLMRAWLNAWSGKSDRFIIFEDDITVSPKWYTWLQRAWDQYESRTDMAGISIMRQTLIPKLPDWGFWREIVNGHAPFLYKLMGSIGFSPHPTRWREFLDWMAQLKDDFDPSVPGLITTHWWQHHPKGSMWEAHFIYKNIQDGLYTMYVNLPKGETLAANMREQGEHYTSTEGADFPLATEVAYHFPKQLQKYDWDGSKEATSRFDPILDTVPDNLKISFVYNTSDTVYDKWRSQIRRLKIESKPLLIKVNAHPCAGKSYFIRTHKKTYRGYKLFDFDDFHGPDRTSKLLLKKTSSSVLFGTAVWDDVFGPVGGNDIYNFEDVIYINVVPRCNIH